MTKLEIDCSKPHCRCMQISPCSNHHYKDCQPNWGKPPLQTNQSEKPNLDCLHPCQACHPKPQSEEKIKFSHPLHEKDGVLCSKTKCDVVEIQKEAFQFLQAWREENSAV